MVSFLYQLLLFLSLDVRKPPPRGGETSNFLDFLFLVRQVKAALRVGEIMMQLLTRSAYPIDQQMCESMQAYARSGKHITPHATLLWPLEAAVTFEDLALQCMSATSSDVIINAVIPTLHRMLASGKVDPPAPVTATAPSPMGAQQENVERPARWFAPPHNFVCPITRSIMLDPVSLADGFVYDRAAAEQWLSTGHTYSPMTNVPLKHPFLTPEHQLRAAIQSWLEAPARF